jgi:hypothetical protein
MRFLAALLSAVLVLSCAVFAEFSMAPYLYPDEDASFVEAISFASPNGSATLYKVKGEESLILLDGKIVSDKAQISAILSKYYQDNHYLSSSELIELKGYADAFNDSRNAMVSIGTARYPAEKTCYGQGTFLSVKPCNDLATCTQTASLICTISGADGCMVDILAIHILDYKKGIDKLNEAYAKFSSAYTSFSPATAATSLGAIDEAFASMKTAADEVSQSKLRVPEKIPCNSECTPSHPEKCCLGVCPEAHFNYASLASGRAKVATLKEKVAPLVLLDSTVDKVAIATSERIAFRAGEEKAVILAPKLDAAKAKYGGLKASAVEARALVSDANFASVADSFLSKSDELEMKLSTRSFDGFDSALSAYESSGRSLAAMLNNSTAAYRQAIAAQDNAQDSILMAQWRVNRLSKASVESYNSLAESLNKLNSQLAPPMSSDKYIALAGKFESLSSDAKAYVAASEGAQEAVFGIGNTFSRATVDGAMALASSITPVSFKTRQGFAKFVPPIMVAAVDLSILAAAVIIFGVVFFKFKPFFRSKLLVSGWILTLLAFTFILLIGSVGFYSIVMSTERFTSFSEFMGTIQPSGSVAIIIEEAGATASAIEGMRSCADSIEAQAKLLNKTAVKYYISNGKCTSFTPKKADNRTNATNSTNSTNSTSVLAYDVKSGISSSECLDGIPDVPIFDLQYAPENSAPSFTTVVTKQAIIKGNEEYYAKKPMCDIANVLG